MKNKSDVRVRPGDVAEAWGGCRGEVMAVSGKGAAERVRMDVDGDTFTGPSKFFTFLFRLEDETAGAR